MMLARYRSLWQADEPSRIRRIGPVAVGLAIALVVTLAAAMVTAAFVAERVEAPRVSAKVFPAPLVQHLEAPIAGGQAEAAGWKQPSDLAFLEERRFVLDTGNDRILEGEESGTVHRVLDHRTDERLGLQGAMAIASDNQYVYVANSGTSEVLVLEPSGQVAKVVALEKAEPEDRTRPRPIGLAVTREDELLVSDGDNHRVLRYGRDGRLLQAIGSGERAAGMDGFNTPAGLSLDEQGNIYVVDILNGRVVQLSPDGAYVRQFGRLGDTAGTLSRPKDVAVDPAGNVYVSDSLLASVQVFDQQGEYLGFIGREKTHDRRSFSLFRAPAGITIHQDRLYVVDRFAGLFVFDLPSRE
jgi:DNA-binding beta-propeller fold protein YncE